MELNCKYVANLASCAKMKNDFDSLEIKCEIAFGLLTITKNKYKYSLTKENFENIFATLHWVGIFGYCN